MTRTKYILRATLLLLTISLLVNLFRKTDDHIGVIAKFKLETLDKIKADSLNAKHKFDLLVNETTKFSRQMDEDTPHIKEAVAYLIGIVVLFIAVELGFSIAERRRGGRYNP